MHYQAMHPDRELTTEQLKDRTLHPGKYHLQEDQKKELEMDKAKEEKRMRMKIEKAKTKIRSQKMSKEEIKLLKSVGIDPKDAQNVAIAEVSKKMNKEMTEKSGDLKDDELYKQFEAQRLQYMHKIATSGTADWDDQLKAYQEMINEKMKNPEAYDVIATKGKSTTMDATWIEPTPGTNEYKKWVQDGRPRPNDVNLIDAKGGVAKADPKSTKINPKTGMTYGEEKLFKEMQQEAKSFKPTVAQYEKQKYVPKWTKFHDYSNFTDKMRRGNLNTDENGMLLEEFSSGFTAPIDGEESELAGPRPFPVYKGVKKNVKTIKTVPEFYQKIQVCLQEAPVNGKCFKFSQRTGEGTIDQWDVSKITDMRNAFVNREQFNGDLSNWNTTAVTSMQGMFKGAKRFNSPLTYWITTNVKDMDRMFDGAWEFDQPLNFLDTRNVKYMNYMFRDTFMFNQDINSWDMRSVLSTEYMFYNATSFNSPLNKWDISNNKVMAHQFENSRVFNQDISMWKVGAVTTMERIFCDAPNFNQDIRGWFDIISKKANTKDIINNGTKAFVKHYSCDDTSDLSSCVPIVSHLEESNGFFGIPRYDPRTFQGFDDLEFGVNKDYTMMLVGQSLPGIAVAIFVLFFSFVFWYRRHWFESCFGRNACNWRPFSGTGLFFARAQLILFALIACLGCFLVWSKGMSLQQDIQVIADSISNSTAEMNALSVRTIQAFDDAKMFTYEAESEALALADAIANISKIDEKTEKYMEVGLSAADVALVIAAVMGLGGIVLVLTSLVGKWRWFTYLTGFLTLSLVCSWLFWGILTSTTTLLADFQYASAEYSVSQKFGYTFDSDLENALPCLDGKDVVKLMNTARMSIAAGVFLYNDFIQMYDPRKTLPLIDQEYDGDAEAASKYCAFDRPGDDYYTAFCDAYRRALIPSNTKTYIKTQRGYFNETAGRNHKVKIDEVGTMYSRCQYDSTQVALVEQCGKEEPAQIPANLFDAMVKNSKVILALKDQESDIMALATCKMVSDALEKLEDSVDDALESMSIVWGGWLIAACAFLLLWGSSLIVIIRLQNGKSGLESITDSEEDALFSVEVPKFNSYGTESKSTQSVTESVIRGQHVSSESTTDAKYKYKFQAKR